MAEIKKTATKKVAAKTIVKKPTVKKVAVKPAKPAAVKKEAVKSDIAVKKPATERKNLSVDVYGLDGKVLGKVSLSVEIFGEKINKQLLAQAVRVYLANKRQGNASTKTRGEVEGSTRKIYRQKGTGRARHGSVRAPIFVKGGIVFGPKPRDFSLDLPKKMRRKALFVALSAKLKDGELKIVSGFEAMAPKTKDFVAGLKKLDVTTKGKMLVIAPDSFESAKRAVRNVQGVSLTAATRLNAYDVLKSKNILLSKEAISEMEKYYIKG